MPEAVNATAGALLGFLRQGPLTGYQLAAQAQERIGGYWTVTRSQVYRELATMADRGLVRRGPTGARDSQPYALTRAGRAAFAGWLAREPEPENLRIPLLLRLTFIDALDRDELRKVLSRHRDEHAARLTAYEQRAGALTDAGVPEEHWLPLRFGIRYERAALGWFAELPEDLRPHCDDAQ